jgi:hypothetical protein
MKTNFTILFTLLVISASAQDITSGLVAQYRFDSNLNDSSGYGLHLTSGANYNFVTDQFGNPNGAVQLVTADAGTFFLGTGPNLANQSSSVTFSVRKDYIGNGSNGSWVFGLGHPAGTGGTDGGDMHVALDYGSSIRYSFFYNDFDVSTPLPNQAWVNLAFTYDYGTGSRAIYINGVLDATDTVGVPFSGGNSLKIGYEGLSLDNFSFYNRTLSPGDVAAIAAPEPSTFGLLAGVTAFGLGLRRRRQPISPAID